MQNTNEILVRVYTAPNKALFLIAKSMLDNAGVEYYTKGENLDLAYGGELVIEVTQDKLNEASEVLKDFIKGEMKSENPEQKIIELRKAEFNYALVIGMICLTIILIFLAVLFVKC
ncbi:MAG: DUF2007 domain-containing protein [Chlorobi bacterium]|nr:DUF2007 domain-containing protein [Chlorobiota bacterium]MCI0715292.1 DUF2007 domain-containing protein [Chlorobiota bacterium]